MAGQKSTPESNAAGLGSKPLLDRLTGAEAALVLRTLLTRHAELTAEAEQIALEAAGDVAPFDVAEEVLEAVCQYDYDDLNSRAGSHSWGYVEPAEGAWELLEEALEPFVSEMKRCLSVGLEDAALRHCQGIALGLYRAQDAANDLLGWAEDFPAEAAGGALDEWRSAPGPEGEPPDPKGSGRVLPLDFFRQHLPKWEWISKVSSGTP